MLRRTTSILKGVTSWSFDLMRGLSVLEDTMGALIFVCPATGEEVPTGIEMDLATLKLGENLLPPLPAVAPNGWDIVLVRACPD